MDWTTKYDTKKFSRYAIWVFIFLLISRLVSMYYVPLNDSTEARYGEISRIMLETGDWITPMHHYGDPFWAKPPLSTWLSAISMKIFNVSAFTVRIPGLLLSLGVLALVFQLAASQSGKRVALLASLVLASCFYFFLNAGTVMTDPALLFCTTLGLVSFWQAVVLGKKLFGWTFFVSLGLGLLAKGPVAVVLTCMPLFVWIVWRKQWHAVWANLPWIFGSVVVLLIALPWYILAELKTPGFLQYFIVGEHIHRFLDPGWGGDKYGFAHVAPYGMIWVYALLGMLPWSFLCVGFCARRFKTLSKLSQDNDGWMLYLLLCTLVPLVFFTFARNIIYPYVFPSLPAFSLLFAEFAKRANVLDDCERRVLILAPLCGVIFLVLTGVFVFKPELVEKSQRRVVEAYQHDKAFSSKSRLIYWTYKTDYSAQFYSSGHAAYTLNPNELAAWLSPDKADYVVLDSEEKTALPQELLARLTAVGTVSVLKKQFTILRAAL